VKLPIHFVRDGEEVINYLKGAGEFADRSMYPLPKLLLLDVNMPRRNGFDVLEWVRLQPGLRRLVVIMFTVSDLQEDIDRAFELGANSYLVKPMELPKLQQIGRLLEEYWMLSNKCAECRVGEQRKGYVTQVLLRNRQTGFYFEATGKWSADPGLGFDFESTVRAAHFARGIGLGEFELLVTQVLTN
jgi:CheY-like chemotaxis protein